MPEDSNEPVALLSVEDSANATGTTPVERLIAREIEAKPESPPFIARPPRRKPGTFLILTGLGLPSIVILIEMTSGICARMFFDPLPTVWHKILVIAVPLSNLLVIYGLWRDDAEYHWRLGLANGLAAVVSAFYTIIYLPLMPLALVALLLAGLGLLALAPALSLIASVVCLRQLRMLASEGRGIYGSNRKPLRDFGFGVALAALILIAIEIPVIVTRVWMAKAASESQAESARAINLLRQYGHEKTLLAACGSQREFASLIGVFINFSYPLDIEKARAVFYRVTGKLYDSARSDGFRVFAFDDQSSDLDETGELRGPGQPDLSLASSRIDGSFDPDAALGYLEWTMVFKNTATLFAVRGAISRVELAKGFPAVRAARSALVNEAWTRDPFSKTGEVIAQRIEPKSSTTPMRAVFVIDGSAPMRDQAASLADALAKMPERGEFAMMIASDEVVELAPMRPATPANAANASEALKRFDFRGGQDNLPALTRAWEIASQNPDSVIVWIHEPVPMLFGSADELRQRWERRPSGAHLFDLQTRRGSNLIIENLSGLAAVNRLTRMGDAPQELRRLFSRFSGGSQQFTATRSKLPAARQATSSDSKETSKHLARLWAFDEVTNLLRLGDGKSSDAAMKLASSYQLVTPLTGAVVLETQEQYQRAGLEPVNPGTVPTIPEPEEWLLMLSALLLLSWILIRRRFACRVV